MEELEKIMKKLQAIEWCLDSLQRQERNLAWYDINKILLDMESDLINEAKEQVKNAKFGEKDVELLMTFSETLTELTKKGA